MSNDQWHDATRDLPKDDEWVLGICIWQKCTGDVFLEPFIAYHSGERWYDKDDGTDLTDSIVYWMDIPEV